MTKSIRFRITTTIIGLVIATTAACTQGPVWPAEVWPTSTPEAQGIRSSVFETLDREIEAGTYGNIDRLVVIRNGYLMVSERYSNDYGEISKGHEGTLGCGIDMCADTAASHEYNYYHPSTHPYYQGRDVHSLQSVTKSVSSAVIGVAVERGEITSLDVPLLSFLEDYDLSRVDDRLHQATLADLLTMRSGIE
jgi:CubicO group peptidase (beta-lactamase class C family)